ncbi:hypothetical protein [Methanobrevibacter curvatus]|uniref:Uncharacterized protein n=1 Tax=Methanobrevibacter curvatus TaxID=49547 RepID=A0A166CDF2_9EURY|nr:hypothetical protein [Methanobrevibacter curvatus]KZX14391.1 hypothetical protein MBCUR_05100 [Methanobrevibacter curvatus]
MVKNKKEELPTDDKKIIAELMDKISSMSEEELNGLFEELNNKINEDIDFEDDTESYDYDDEEFDEPTSKEMLKEVFSNLSASEDLSEEETKKKLEEFEELFEYGDNIEEDENENDELNDFLSQFKDYVITENTFNNENILINFDEYLLLTLVEINNFINYDETQSKTALLDSATIFTEKLGMLNNTYNKKNKNSSSMELINKKEESLIKKSILNSANIVENYKKHVKLDETIEELIEENGLSDEDAENIRADFIEEIANVNGLIKSIEDKLEENQKLYESIGNYMEGLRVMGKSDVDGDLYNKVLTGLLDNFEKSVENFDTIGKSIDYLKTINKVE